jgi:hypothetical protein
MNSLEYHNRLVFSCLGGFLLGHDKCGAHSHQVIAQTEE